MAQAHPAGGGSVSAIVYNPILMPGKDPVFAHYTILTNQVLVKGSVLGVVTASGKLKLTAAAAGDGSEVAMAVLMEDLDTTGADKGFQVLVEGFVNETALTFGAAHTADTCRHALRAQGIYLTAPRYGAEA
jgi:hypothetical protein